MNDTIYILDGYGIIYRAYFAFINRPLTDRDGKNVSAIYGFFKTLSSLKRGYKAENIVVALDPAGPTFRHEIYSQYKATRDKAPEDLHAQVPFIEELLDLLGVPVLRMDRYEADDVMGSVAQLCRDAGRSCRLVSADKDLMQLVDDKVHLLRPEKGGKLRDFGPDEVLEEKGVRPDQIIDYLALIGDSSDNIPGVPGIGPKTASGLLAQWDSLDGIYANLDSAVKGARKTKLEEGKENAYFSQTLVTIKTDLDIPGGFQALSGGDGDYVEAAARFRAADLPTVADDWHAPSTDSVVGGPPTLDVQYEAILDQEGLDKWGELIKKAGLAALDTETDNIDPLRANLVGLSLSVEAGKAAYLPLKRPDGPCLDQNLVLEWLSDLFGDGGSGIVGQNFKYDMKVLRRAGLVLPGPHFDTMIAAWVLDSSSPVGMDVLSNRYLNHKTVKFHEVVPKGGTFDDVPLYDAVRYAAEDADITWRLYEVLEPMLAEDEEKRAVFRDIEQPLIPILASMESEGIGLDIFALEAYGDELSEAVGGLEKEIYALCGREFNIASPKQLQTVLFEERKLTPGKKTKTGYSTDNTVLTELAKEDPVPEKILLHRSLSKLKSTYVDALPKMVNPGTGRVHTNYVQTGAATGRLSSKDPNLQNIPIRDENGRRIREAFRARPGHLFISADYSQIELVVLAHMSGDKELSQAFREGTDVHARTAGLLFGIPAQEVSSERRRMAKAVNFGVMYGMSAFRLSNELGIPRKEAKEFIEAYFATYTGIKAFVDETVEKAERDGGVRTLYGRFRPLPGIGSRNKVEKAAAERAAVNSRIQGTAADIVKKAMIALDRRLAESSLKTKLLLQVHDEVLLEVPESEQDAVKKLLKITLESAVSLDIPLRVNVETGDSWGSIH